MVILQSHELFMHSVFEPEKIYAAATPGLAIKEHLISPSPSMGVVIKLPLWYIIRDGLGVTTIQNGFGYGTGHGLGVSKIQNGFG